MGFSRQEHWSGLLWLSSGDLPEPRIEPASSVLQAVLYHELLDHQEIPNKVFFFFLIFFIKKYLLIYLETKF